MEERLFQLDGILPGKVKKTEPGMASSEAGAAAAAHVYEEPKPTVVKVEPGAAAQLSDKYIKKESQYHWLNIF